MRLQAATLVFSNRFVRRRSVRVLFILLLGVAGVSFVLNLGVWRAESTLDGPFRHAGGFAYTVPVEYGGSLSALLRPDGDSSRGNVSRLRLTQDGKPLPHPHAGPVDIAEQGDGRYSHWGAMLLVAPLGNVDPRVADVNLQASYPLQVRREIRFFVYGLLGLIVLAAMPALLANSPVAEGRDWGSRSIWGRPRTYWTLFAIILTAGIGLRIASTLALETPFVTPDSASYVSPAVADPLLPLSEVRTAGLPYLIALGHAVFEEPIGILAVSNVLWLASTLALVLAIYLRLGMPVASLWVLTYLCFVQKNFTFEYYLMSEHAARCFFVLYFALLIIALRSAARLWVPIALFLVVAFNILVKPSAVVLVPATLLFYAIVAVWLQPRRYGRLVFNSGLFVVLVAASLVGYAGLFKERFGSFELTHFTGHNYYSHVGHLTQLDGDAHPELKQQLRNILTKYVANYANHGRYYPNWLIYGSVDADLARDFGTVSPASLVSAYAARQAEAESHGESHAQGTQTAEKPVPPQSQRARANQVFRDLAVEAVLAHPGQYLVYSLDRMAFLFLGGLSFSYQEFARPSWLNDHARNVVLFTDLCEEPLCTLEGEPAHFRPEVRRWMENLFYVYTDIADAIEVVSIGILVSATLLGGVVVISPHLRWRLAGVIRHRPDRSVMFVMAVLVVFGYGLFLGLVNVAEPRRFMTNVQDLVVVGSVLALAMVLSAIGPPAAERLRSWREKTSAST